MTSKTAKKADIFPLKKKRYCIDHCSLQGSSLHLKFFEPTKESNLIKVAYNQSQSDDRLYKQPAPLTDQVSMLTVLVAGTNNTQVDMSFLIMVRPRSYHSHGLGGLVKDPRQYSSEWSTIGSRALSFSDPYFHFTCLSVRHSVIRSVILSVCPQLRS